MKAGRRETELLSSAFTLSDMEIFVFPELLYPLVLANIMSPVIWKWRDDSWFKGIHKKKLTARVNRVKQFIIQNYVFNLDLETWGLTNKDKELERFKPFFDTTILEKTNALMGYEGDRYYFDIDIRKHFGLTKYTSEIIPYWKTETVEAMEAFRLRQGFDTGAGECVSLSALYAAALFVVGNIPLESIFLIATPLHSQNYIAEGDGILTNNRRIVTKKMWYNGTSLSQKARRALENERVTIVSHISGFNHFTFQKASIERDAYVRFADHLNKFLNSNLDANLLVNFLRFNKKYKEIFQYRTNIHSSTVYIPLEKMFEYEHSSRFNLNESRQQLIKEIDRYDFSISPINGRVFLNDIEEMLKLSPTADSSDQINNIKHKLAGIENGLTKRFINDMKSFLHTSPNLPSTEKEYINYPLPDIKPGDNREEIIRKIYSVAESSESGRLAIYVFRDMEFVDWHPFLTACMERNPVSQEALTGLGFKELYDSVLKFGNRSIYDGNRLATPDEVINFSTGDGIEKALLMTNLLNIDGRDEIIISICGNKVELRYTDKTAIFTTVKNLNRVITVKGNKYSVKVT